MLSPVPISYREFGAGPPLVFLHGGWGYEVYPFDRQIAAFARKFRIVIPDRSGYGRSPRVDGLPLDFHRRAAAETLAVLDALALDRPVIWGHSDGAVIAVLMALDAPARLRGVILEAIHYFRNKPRSRAFFEAMVADPACLGERVLEAVARDHGDPDWRAILLSNGRAWLALADESPHPAADLYDGRLSALAVPAIVLHGRDDPRTELDELDAIRRALPRVPLHVIPDAGHSPHSQAEAADRTGELAGEFLAGLGR